MAAIDDLAAKIRDTLSVSSSWDTRIVDEVRGAVRRLLKDYNFPKTLMLQKYEALPLATQFVDLPSGFKRPVEVRIHKLDSGEHYYTGSLRRNSGFVMPASDKTPSHYWIIGNQLYINNGLPDGYDIYLWYQSADYASNVDWMLSDFGDAVFWFATTRCCPIVKKADLLPAYAPLWGDEQKSLAIYLNELEWNDIDMVMNEPEPERLRYRYDPRAE